jgi:hypothetical protein
MLRHLSRTARQRQQGRIVLILTASHYYALHGVRPGARLSKVALRLYVSRRIRIGLNDWYVTSNRSSHGVLKVRHGVIQEVGLASIGLTRNFAAAQQFLRNLRAG